MVQRNEEEGTLPPATSLTLQQAKPTFLLPERLLLGFLGGL